MSTGGVALCGGLEMVGYFDAERAAFAAIARPGVDDIGGTARDFGAASNTRDQLAITIVRVQFALAPILAQLNVELLAPVRHSSVLHAEHSRRPRENAPAEPQCIDETVQPVLASAFSPVDLEAVHHVVE